MTEPVTKERLAAPMQALARYEEDLYRWSLEQAALLRASASREFDTKNIAEELEDLGSSQYDKLESALTVLLLHMLKWDYQPERRSRSWASSISTQRRHYAKVLKKNPGLRSRLKEALLEAYVDARAAASGETNLPPRTFPTDCPYSWPDILDRPFGFASDDESA